jgi:predicted phage baseplate assembly protein
MALPAPRLDDRSFQDLVDDAKRFVQERCPGWTDHNVSDPGVTLIETFAWMTDLLLYRLNRVPDRLYVKFLDLIGTQLFPPTAATVEVDFRLSAPQEGDTTIPRGSVVATRRSGTDAPTSFSTLEELTVVASSVSFVGSGSVDGTITARDDELLVGQAVAAFSEAPVVGESLVVAFDKAVPHHLVQLELVCVEGAGEGIDVRYPPLRWEAWTSGGWQSCEVLEDGTWGLNRNGLVELVVPREHVSSDLGGRSGGLLRCRVVAAEGFSPYRRSPRLTAVSGHTIGAVTTAVHATFVEGEQLGESTGVAGQEFQLSYWPVVPSDEVFVVEEHRPSVPGDPGAGAISTVHLWELRSNFADSDQRDRHVTLDRSTGVLRFGPMVRNEDGSTRQYGAIPAKGSLLVVPRYRVGGGAGGNVSTGAISVLRTSIPFVASVHNRRPASGGVDGEALAEAKLRGPVQLRTRNRAVTIEDFEALTREAAPDVRRVKAVLDDSDGTPGAIRVHVVPAVSMEGHRIDIASLDPPPELRESIRSYLDRRRLVGTRIHISGVPMVGVTVRASIRVEPHAEPEAVRVAAEEALHRHFNPVSGGVDGGWPFGRSVTKGEAFGVVQAVAGVDVVLDLVLSWIDLAEGETTGDVNKVDLSPNELVLSVDHEVTVVEDDEV